MFGHPVSLTYKNSQKYNSLAGGGLLHFRGYYGILKRKSDYFKCNQTVLDIIHPNKSKKCKTDNEIDDLMPTTTAEVLFMQQAFYQDDFKNPIKNYFHSYQIGLLKNQRQDTIQRQAYTILDAITNTGGFISIISLMKTNFLKFEDKDFKIKSTDMHKDIFNKKVKKDRFVIDQSSANEQLESLQNISKILKDIGGKNDQQTENFDDDFNWNQESNTQQKSMDQKKQKKTWKNIEDTKLIQKWSVKIGKII
ncbi:UNKNOWN [Stylonychia lemnae]|uniref:Uncharacterized protein n=1 Tax=Stylonychia lemnae TaxID=5949 RepID=A0A078B9X3_STYLE|nr:UNKNOWN [Stylonychia lemnae]|eukprot:CDW91011.1 UNKNOWN [Stylonychia lemnae]